MDQWKSTFLGPKLKIERAKNLNIVYKTLRLSNTSKLLIKNAYFFESIQGK